MRMSIWMIAALVGMGCATTGERSGSSVGVRTGPTSGVQANLDEEGLFGHEVAVRKQGKGLRGHMLNRVVDLEWNDEVVVGMVDSGPTRLVWSYEAGPTLRIRGLHSGRSTDLRVSAAGIEGTMGSCGYSLVGASDGFHGTRVCDGRMNRDTFVALPDLRSRSSGERVALIALLLTGGSRGGDLMSAHEGIVAPAYDAWTGRTEQPKLRW